MATFRYLKSFETSDRLTALTFPLGMAEWQSKSPLRIPQIIGSGQNYSNDILRGGIAIRAVATETFRCLINETTVALAEAKLDEIRSKCLIIGRGIVYTVDSDGTEKWAYARVTEIPSFSVNLNNNQSGRLGVILNFERYSDWFNNTLTTVTQTVTATGQTWTVTNAGNIYAELMTITLTPNTATGIINPKITNNTTGSVLETARDSAATTDRIKYATEAATIGYSTNSGGSYADDLAQYVMPTTQTPLTFLLKPGANTIKYEGGGTVRVDVKFEFYPVYA